MTTGPATPTKSDEADQTEFVVHPLKGPLRVREARQRIGELEHTMAEGQAKGRAMCEAFARQFPKAPAKIVRYRDRSLTFYRWRQSSSKQWNSDTNTAIALTGKAGLELLARVPESARQQWLEYERRRIYLNLQLSLTAYELYRLRDWVNAQDAIKAIERHGLDAELAAAVSGDR